MLILAKFLLVEASMVMPAIVVLELVPFRNDVVYEHSSDFCVSGMKERRKRRRDEKCDGYMKLF